MTFTRRGARRVLLVASLELIACGDSHSTVDGPPPEKLLITQEQPCDPSAPDPMTCTFVYFSDEALIEACVVPDRDSFDDYTQYRMDANGQVLIDPITQMPVVAVPRGKTPYPGSDQCKADGIVTGPKGDTYYPSKFCRVTCRRSGSAGSGAP